MVHVTTPRPNLGAAIGQGLGQGIGQHLERQYESGQLEKGLSGLKNLSPDASPSEVLSQLVKASAMSPEIGRNLGPLYQAFQQEQNARRIAEGLGGAIKDVVPGQIGAQGKEIQLQTEPGPQIQQESVKGLQKQEYKKGQTGKEIDERSNEYLSQLRPDLTDVNSNFGRVPTFDFASKSSLTPDEESTVRTNLNSQKVPPAVQDQIIDKLNTSIGNRYNEALKNFDITGQQQQAINQKWDTIKGDAPVQLSPFINQFPPKTQSFLQNRYFKYAASEPTNLTPEAVEGNAMAKIQKDIDQLNALSELPPMPPVRQFGDIKSNMDNTKKAYKPLIDAGMVDAVKEDAIFNKDMGIEEMHEAIWGDQTDKNLLRQISDIKKGKNQDAYVDQLAKKISKLGPNDDLVLTRSMVLDGDGTINDYVNALDLAQNKYGLKLSPFQEAQIQESQLPRTRPLWEIFAEPDPISSGFGVLGMGFKHFLNYVRGKR
jgi:DNA-binding transcriptional regulator YhcF (GntR family)